MKKADDTPKKTDNSAPNSDQALNSRQIHYVPKYIFVVLLATVFSWLLGDDKIKYQFHSNVGFETGFPGNIDNWKRAGDWANVEFSESTITVNRNTENKSYAKYEIAIPDDALHENVDIRVSGLINVDIDNELIDTAPDSEGGSFMVWFRDSNDEIIKYANVQEFNASQAEYTATKILAIPPEARSFEIVLNSRNSNSAMSLVDASVELLQQTNLYKLGLAALLMLWLLIGLMGVRWLISYGNITLTITLALLVVAIFIGVLLPENFMSNQIDRRLINYFEISPSSRDNILEIIYKSGHFIFFFLVSLVVVLNSHKLNLQYISALSLLILLAIATEGMQLHLLGRTTRLFDLGVDVIGIILAAGLAILLSRVKKTKLTQ